MTENDFELDNRIFFRLFQAANLMHKEGTKALLELGVTTQQWSVLGALSRDHVIKAEGMSVNELAQYLMVSRQSLGGTLKRIERAGLIERTVDTRDGRARRIRLSQKGKKRWAELQPLIRSFYRGALHGMSTREKKNILHCLSMLSANMTMME